MYSLYFHKSEYTQGLNHRKAQGKTGILQALKVGGVQYSRAISETQALFSLAR